MNEIEIKVKVEDLGFGLKKSIFKVGEIENGKFICIFNVLNEETAKKMCNDNKDWIYIEENLWCD